MINNDNSKEAIESYIKTIDINDIVINPSVSGIVNLIAPIFGGIVSDTVKSAFNDSIIKKQKILIENIMNDNEICLNDIPDKVAFIHDFNRIYECVIKLKSNEKIKYFANILKSEYKKDNKINRADDFTNLLDSISYESLTIFAKLYLYEIHNNIKNNSQLSEVSVHWKDFIDSCISYDESFTKNIVNTHLSILQSKGLCNEYKGSYTDYNGGIYRITEYGYLFIKSINNYQFEKEFIDPKDEIYETLKSGEQPYIAKYGIVNYYNYLKILEKENKLKLSEPINVLNAPCSQYKVLEVY